jgi:hypothetical protein
MRWPALLEMNARVYHKGNLISQNVPAKTNKRNVIMKESKKIKQHLQKAALSRCQIRVFYKKFMGYEAVLSGI